jgi:uncharacterized membrane protein YheB (UPF0754 family)
VLKWLQASTRELVDKVARAEAPDVWAAMSEPVKAALVDDVAAGSERYILLLMVALQREILNILDLKGLMGRIVANDKQILCDMFLSTGGKEFVFIRRSGFYFGFLFGLFQACACCMRLQSLSRLQVSTQ